MLVERYTYQVKRACMPQVVELWKPYIGAVTGDPARERLYTSGFGQCDTIAAEFEFEDWDQLVSKWEAFLTRPELPEFWEKWNAFLEPGGTREMWQLVD